MVATIEEGPRLAFGGVTISEDLSERLRAVRSRIEDIDRLREGLIEERDRLIVEARRRGGSLREVADVVGMSHMSVKLIAERDQGT